MSAAGGHARRSAAIETGLAAAGLCLFAAFTHDGLPWRVVAAAGLAVTALALHRTVVSAAAPADLLGLHLPRRGVPAFLAAGFALGAILALGFRWRQDLPLLPRDVHGFVLTAALIGTVEELVYRGYLQGRLQVFGTPWTVILPAAAHAAYKCSLFARPHAGVAVNFVILASATLLGGTVFGLLRARAGSVWPAVLAHACFDVLVYGDRVQAPWWVWQ